MKPILVIEQEHSLRGLGLLGERLDASGLTYRSLRGWDEAVDELHPNDFAAIIPMGGNAHAWDEDGVPLLRDERVLLRTAVEEGVPVFGICLGAQVLARALGGEVRTAPEPEIGWLEIAPTEAAADDPVFSTLADPTGVYQWHYDVFEPPPGSQVLATSPLAPNQAYRVDGADAWGIQFHPEATPDLWELWIARHPTEVAEAGVDVDALRDEVKRGAEASLEVRSSLFDAFLDRVRARWRA
ncbi:MAG TPA: type 1 glutamine amidotransferase [Gaiellaceae bacterium]